MDGFKPLAATFDELDELYYAEAERLPGAETVDSCYPLGPIDYYYEHCPEDFTYTSELSPNQPCA